MIDTDKPPAALGNYTGFLLNWVGARARDAFTAALADSDLKLHHFAVMSMISAQPGETQNGLVASTGIDASTMVQMLDELEQVGLAERRPHPTDRRKRALYLTDKGTKSLGQARRTAGRTMNEAFGPLSDAERKQLHALLRKAAGFED